MRRLLTGYAQEFNRRHRRHRVLLQNRYKLILCEGYSGRIFIY
jgi:putative transposase